MKETVQNTLNSYLTFKIGSEIFAAPVNSVMKILEMVSITRIPHTPMFIKGIINLSGAVLPVVDARIKLGFEETLYDKDACIIVLEIPMDNGTEHIGIIVDGAREVIELEQQAIQAPPAFGKKYELDCIAGIISRNNTFIILLDIPAFFSQEDILSFNQLSTP